MDWQIWGVLMNADTGHALDTIVDFLTAVGLAPVETVFEQATLLPGVDIGGGRLLLDRARLVWPGDLLHEAGHIAVTPAALRHILSGALDDDATPPHAGEAEATAWAYAALVATGLPPEVLFHGGGYHGASPSLIFTYTTGVYPGAAGLCAAGMAATPAEARSQGLPAYPQLRRWLRE